MFMVYLLAWQGLCRNRRDPYGGWVFTDNLEALKVYVQEIQVLGPVIMNALKTRCILKKEVFPVHIHVITYGVCKYKLETNSLLYWHEQPNQ